ncbi:MAG TPA: riboflavin biosynthesis protein RibF, partial [Chryseobacterium sp.]|nr:riboflavin biosynthesis protein RibF [Chryseobacterium sp.]
MKIHTDFNRSANARPLALSIGMFDGVHRGHQAILERLKDVAAQQNLETGIISFWPHPRTVFQPDEPLHLLTILEEKQKLLKKNGLHHLFLKSFDEDFR